MTGADSDAIEFETTRCPLCDADESTACLTARDLLYGQPGEFQLVRCASCGHVYLNPRPTRACIGRFYPRHYAPFRLDECTFGDSQPAANRGVLLRRLRACHGLRRFVHWLLESQAEWIPPAEGPQKPWSTFLTCFVSERLPARWKRAPREDVSLVAPEARRALEIGCADGSFLERLRNSGWQVEGVEPAAEAAERARSRGLKVHVGTLESAAFGDAQFDAAFAFMVVEHLHDPKQTLAEIRRVLKPSGTLVISVPNFACWERRVFGRYWYALQLPTHLQHFTPRTIRRLLDESGFDVQKLIHQRNVNNILGSVALWCRQRPWCAGLGDRLMRFIDNPTARGLLPLVPLAKHLAWLKQSGRLTVVARARASSSVESPCYPGLSQPNSNVGVPRNTAGEPGGVSLLTGEEPAPSGG